MKNYKSLVGAFLVGVAIFSLGGYCLALKEQYRLASELKQAKLQVSSLEKEKQNLLQELEKEKISLDKFYQEKSLLKGHLRSSQERITRLFRDLGQVQREVDKLQSQINSLNAKNSSLKESLTQAERQKDELKRASVPVQAPKEVVKETKKKSGGFFGLFARKDKPKTEDTSAGNAGFVVKNTQAVSPEKVKIEVTAAP